jgi:hypothetical protein
MVPPFSRSLIDQAKNVLGLAILLVSYGATARIRSYRVRFFKEQNSLSFTNESILSSGLEKKTGACGWSKIRAYFHRSGVPGRLSAK